MKKTIVWAMGFQLACGYSQATGLVSPDSNVKSQEEINGQFIDMTVFCKSNPCRQDVHFLLRTEAGKIDQQAAVYWPVVQDDKISLLAGEKVLIEADFVDEQFKDLVKVSDSNKAMSFDLQQDDKELSMMLVIKNPYKFAIKVSIDMIDFEGNLHETSSCPVIAGGSVYEMWPHPIMEILISDIKKYDDSKGMRCVY